MMIEPMRISSPFRHNPIRAVATASLTSITATLPVFLVGGLSVLVRKDLGFSETQLGGAVSAGFIVATLFSVPAGRLIERIGARRGMVLTVLWSSLCLIGLGTIAASWKLLLMLVAASGVGLALSVPSSNLAVAQSVPIHRQGLAFGIKTTAAPWATMLAGLVLPLVGLQYGWDWAFRGAAVLALPVLLLVAGLRLPAGGRIPRQKIVPIDLPLVLLAATAAAGMAAATAMVSFYVETAVGNGIEAGTAGHLLALGGAVGIAGRILWGLASDRVDRVGVKPIVVLFGTGALGAVGMGAAADFWLLLPATVVGFGTGWSWPGVLMATVAREYVRRPATALGVVAMGFFLGGSVGPVAVGAIIEHISTLAGWIAIAGSLLVAAMFAFGATRILGQRRLAQGLTPR